MKTKEKIVILFLIISLVTSAFINYKVYAAEKTYKVEQVTSAADINSNNLYRYIITYERDNGTTIALTAMKGSGSGYAISRNNFREVTIENGVLTTETEDNILWNFTKSKASVLEEGDHPAIESVTEIASGSNRKQLKISSGGSSGNGGYPGIRFSENGNGFTFEQGEGNTIKICGINCEDPENNYLTFGNYFKKGPQDEAINFKIYKVVKEYNYESSHFISSEQLAQMEDVSVKKEVNEYVNYGDTGIALVSLKTKGTSMEKNCDIILILDDSTSVYTEAPQDNSKTRAQIIREDALMFSEKILATNPDNRICVIKFGRYVTNEDVVDEIGFSNDIDKIEQMIGGDRDISTGFGTDFSSGFRKANEVFEAKSSPDHGKVVLFISDGMPSYYNGISYSTFSETPDSTGEATNWINFITKTPLDEAMLMSKTGTAIYTVGSLEESTSVNGSDGYILPAQTTKDVLSNVATGSANFYDFDKIETELENILNRLAKEFNYYPTNAEVKDKISTDIALLDRKVNEVVPEIVFKRNNEEVERITFSDDGTEAHSSVLGPDVNILSTTNGVSTFDGKYVSFDGNTVTWKIGDLFRDEFQLDYYIYLKKAANLNGDGNDLPTGTYPTSDTVTLTYTDVTNEEVVEETEKPTLNWVNPKQPEKNNNNNSNPTGGAPAGGAPGGDGGAVPAATNNQAKAKKNNLLPMTGDNISVTALSILLIVVFINVYQIRFSKTRRKVTRYGVTSYRKTTHKQRKSRIEREMD